jgi:exodeoxyribonuclease-5
LDVQDVRVLQKVLAAVTDITPSDKQADAIAAIVDWYRDRSRDQQVFRLFGFAGVGKTTVLKYALDELSATTMPRMSKKDIEDYRAFETDEADPDDRSLPPRVMNMAFTGKASLVMTRKGTPATTIHSAIYSVHEPTKEAIAKAKEELAKLQEQGQPEGMSALMYRAMIRDRELQIKNLHQPVFLLNPDGPVRDASLIVLDEVSMVGEDMASDLISFGKPILVLGDPGQLPPIRGEGAFTQAEPDVMLTEIHRQAEDSAIIRLATMAREGKYIPFGRHSDEVWKMSRGSAQPEQMMGAGQVLCGMNATRYFLNNQMRLAAGYSNVLPTGDAAQKIIALKNQNDIGIVNGMFLRFKEIASPQEKAFRALIETEDGDDLGWHSVYSGHFHDHEAFDKDRGQRDHWDKKGKTEATWGYAITVHKSQGSQWENVVLYDDGFGRGEDRKRWLYTAITRAEKGLLVLG